MGRVMRAVQHVLVCYVSCVRLAPPPHTRMPLVGPTSAPARKGRCGSPRCSEEGPAKAVPAAVATAAATTTGSEPEVLFPRLTDDGYSFYDDRYVSSGGSEAWLQNLKGTPSLRPNPNPTPNPTPNPKPHPHPHPSPNPSQAR